LRGADELLDRAISNGRSDGDEQSRLWKLRDVQRESIREHGVCQRQHGAEPRLHAVDELHDRAVSNGRSDGDEQSHVCHLRPGLR
jgi:hypothetical protein